ncbi:hypothetical protein KW782_03030 [Candidatus Parcubacteria bacterium]|nr:hypothetical protein [Candidatus Parcubacteria bacterium]
MIVFLIVIALFTFGASDNGGNWIKNFLWTSGKILLLVLVPVGSLVLGWRYWDVIKTKYSGTGTPKWIKDLFNPTFIGIIAGWIAFNLLLWRASFSGEVPKSLWNFWWGNQSLFWVTTLAVIIGTALYLTTKNQVLVWLVASAPFLAFIGSIQSTWFSGPDKKDRPAEVKADAPKIEVPPGTVVEDDKAATPAASKPATAGAKGPPPAPPYYVGQVIKEGRVTAKVGVWTPEIDAQGLMRDLDRRYAYRFAYTIDADNPADKKIDVLVNNKWALVHPPPEDENPSTEDKLRPWKKEGILPTRYAFKALTEEVDVIYKIIVLRVKVP